MLFDPPNASIEVIELTEGHRTPSGQEWARIRKLPRGVNLTGSLPTNAMTSPYGWYRSDLEAADAAVAHAMRFGCGVLYLERH